MHRDNTKRTKLPNNGPRRLLVDAVAMLVYLLLVYAISLRLGPLGRDFQAMADPASLPLGAAQLVSMEVAAFGSWPLPYHLVNLILFYGCMLCAYRFVRLTLPGPFWLGTLSATLFMANPVHSEAVLNLTAPRDLIPALLALATLAAYAEHAVKPRRWTYPLAVALFALAVLPYRENAFLVAVTALYEALCLKEARRPIRLAPLGAISAAAWLLHSDLFTLHNLHPSAMFAPLYLIFYPLGLLPETALQFHTHPWLGWLSAFAVVAVIGLIYRKAPRPVILFGLLAMASVRLFQGGQPIDLVHMIGGGRLLLANALFNLALVALFYRMVDLPQWRRPIIMMTTTLALVFFGMQIAMIMRWHEASRVVQSFQTAAKVNPAPLGVVPDYRCYRGAPVMLSESIAYDTPFSQKTEHVSLLQLNYLPAPELDVRVVERTDEGLVANIHAAKPVDAAPYPFTLLDQAQPQDDGSLRIKIMPAVQPASIAPCSMQHLPLAIGSATVQYAVALAAVGAAEPQEGSDMQITDEFTPAQRAVLDQAAWHQRVGDLRAVWVSISEQMLRVIEKGAVVWQAPCSTAKNGYGSKVNSLKTPLGWHSVAEKIGDGAPWGQVFREKRPTREIWKRGDKPAEDLVLTRVLTLQGEEAGLNKGGDVDSYARCIYIHGTNGEDLIGTPVSHGCIRLTNDDVLIAFDKIPPGAPVLISR